MPVVSASDIASWRQDQAFAVISPHSASVLRLTMVRVSMMKSTLSRSMPEAEEGGVEFWHEPGCGLGTQPDS